MGRAQGQRLKTPDVPPKHLQGLLDLRLKAEPAGAWEGAGRGGPGTGDRGSLRLPGLSLLTRGQG